MWWFLLSKNFKNWLRISLLVIAIVVFMNDGEMDYRY